MADFDKISINRTYYNVKDATARNALSEAETKLNEIDSELSETSAKANDVADKMAKLPIGTQFSGGRLYNSFYNPANYDTPYTYVDGVSGNDETAKPLTDMPFKTLDAALQAALSVSSNALIVFKTSGTYTCSLTGFSNSSFHFEAEDGVNVTVKFTGSSLFFYSSHVAFNGPSSGSLTVDFQNIENVRFESASSVHNNATIKAKYLHIIGGVFSVTSCTMLCELVNNGAIISASQTTFKPSAVRSRIAVIENLWGRASFDTCTFDASGIASLGSVIMLYAYAAQYNIMNCSAAAKLANVRPYYLSTSELRTTDTDKLASYGDLKAIATGSSTVVTTNTP